MSVNLEFYKISLETQVIFNINIHHYIFLVSPGYTLKLMSLFCHPGVIILNISEALNKQLAYE